MAFIEQLPDRQPHRKNGAPSSISPNYHELVQNSPELGGNDAEPSEAALKNMSTFEIYKSAHATYPQTTMAGVALWWQEVVAITLLCAAVIASYATVRPYQNATLPQWPLKITISSLLSVYSLVLRLAAGFLIAQGLAQLKWRWFNTRTAPLYDLKLYDDASRGPVGSLQLLWRLPRPNTWVWLGCILFLAGLATGPLTQLALQYESCSVAVSAQVAALPRSQVFLGQGKHEGAGIEGLSLGAQLAMNAGIYSSGSVGVECSSGNCTFAPYKSIGYCSKCNVVSDEVQFTLTGIDNTNVSTFIPGPFNINVSSDGTPIMPLVSEVAAFNGTDILFGPPNLKNGSLVDCSQNRTRTCQGYAAASCRMFPCIREYNASVANGILDERVINTWDDSSFGTADEQWPDGNLVISTIYKPCLTTQQSSQLRAWNYTFDGQSPWLAYNGTANEPLDWNITAQYEFEQDLLNSQCLYSMDLQFLQGLQVYLQSGPFNGKLEANMANDGTGVESYSGPQLLLTVYNYGNISLERTQGVFDNLTTSLTNEMRANPYDPNPSAPPQINGWDKGGFDLARATKSAQGTVYATKTCLQVRWGWLAFPTVVAVLTLVFFTGVLLSSSGLARDVRTWKSSPLPLLLFGLSDTPAISQHVKDLEEMARSTSVRLTKDVDGNMVLRNQSAV